MTETFFFPTPELAAEFLARFTEATGRTGEVFTEAVPVGRHTFTLHGARVAPRRRHVTRYFTAEGTEIL